MGTDSGIQGFYQEGYFENLSSLHLFIYSVDPLYQINSLLLDTTQFAL